MNKQRRQLIVWLFVYLTLSTEALPPAVIHQQCYYRTIRARSRSRPDDVAVFAAAHIDLYFDQPLFIDGQRSLERIYTHGKLQDVEDAIDGLMRFCWNGRCFASTHRSRIIHHSSDGAEDNGIEGSVPMTDPEFTYVSFLARISQPNLQFGSEHIISSMLAHVSSSDDRHIGGNQLHIHFIEAHNRTGTMPCTLELLEPTHHRHRFTNLQN